MTEMPHSQPSASKPIDPEDILKEWIAKDAHLKRYLLELASCIRSNDGCYIDGHSFDSRNKEKLTHINVCHIINWTGEPVIASNLGKSPNFLEDDIFGWAFPGGYTCDQCKNRLNIVDTQPYLSIQSIGIVLTSKENTELLSTGYIIQKRSNGRSKNDDDNLDFSEMTISLPIDSFLKLLK